MITVPVLIAAGIAPTQAKLFVEPLSAACALFDISTIKRQAGFIAQTVHESANFTALEENLFYSKPSRIRQVWKWVSEEDAVRLARKPVDLANFVYAKKNGNSKPGDGWKYRGRGLIGLTGIANYLAAEKGTGRPYVDNPDLVAQPSDACLAAAWFWHENGCNQLIDQNRFDETTRRINGAAMLAKDERKRLFSTTQLAFATGNMMVAA